MLYALNLDEEGRILSATFDQYAPASQPRVAALPDGDLCEYRYIDGAFVYDPLPIPEPSEPTPTPMERIAALEEQLAATKILLGVE